MRRRASTSESFSGRESKRPRICRLPRRAFAKGARWGTKTRAKPWTLLRGIDMLRSTGLLILMTAGLVEAQDGAALYKARCASCHDSSEGRVPSIGTIKQMTGEAVYAALTNGAMKSQTSGLSTQELISLLVYIAPAGNAGAKPAFERSCTGNAPLD